MAEPIPTEWRGCVVRILRTNDRKHIHWTTIALQRWKADTFGAWDFEAYDAMIECLNNPGIEGDRTTTMSGQDSAYEFLFHYQNKLMYGKIALYGDKARILVLSAHRAERSTLR